MILRKRERKREKRGKAMMIWKCSRHRDDYRLINK